MFALWLLHRIRSTKRKSHTSQKTTKTTTNTAKIVKQKNIKIQIKKAIIIILFARLNINFPFLCFSGLLRDQIGLTLLRFIGMVAISAISLFCLCLCRAAPGAGVSKRKTRRPEKARKRSKTREISQVSAMFEISVFFY